MSLSNISQYCYVELFDSTACLIKRNKIKCSEGKFSCYFSLDNLLANSTYYTRVYTRYMQNLPANRLPVKSFRTNYKDFAITHSDIIPPVQLRVKDYLLIFKNLRNTNYTLYLRTETEETDSLIIKPISQGTIALPKLKNPYVLHCSLYDTNKNKIVYDTFMPVKPSHKPHIMLSSLPDICQIKDKLKFSISDTICSSFLLAYFEPDIYELSNRLVKHLTTTHIQHLDHIYHYPETVMSISGSAHKENGKTLEQGLITAFDASRGLHYDADLDSTGWFTMGIDDFWEGTEFYMEAFDKKGIGKIKQNTIYCTYSPH